MRRLCRRSLNVLTALSLVLCVATCAACAVGVSVGGLSEAQVQALPVGSHVTEPLHFEAGPGGAGVIRYHYDVGPWECTGTPVQPWFVLPSWLLVPALAALPAARAWPTLAHRLRAARRRGMAGRCPSCRYDLTGNMSGVCPECGRPVGGPTAQMV